MQKALGGGSRAVLLCVLVLIYRSFEGEADALVEAEEQVHRVDGCAGTAFQAGVNHRVEGELITVLCHVDKALVGVSHVGGFGPMVDDKCEVVVVVELVEHTMQAVFINIVDNFNFCGSYAHFVGADDADVDVGGEVELQGLQSGTEVCHGFLHINVNELGQVNFDIYCAVE